MRLSRRSEPFDSDEFVYELKIDGFRALAYVEDGQCDLISRNGNTFKSFPGLCQGLARDLKGRRCVLDGEIVCLDREGRSQFNELLFHRAEPQFYAFDLLWDEHAKTDDESEKRRFRNGEDLRYLPLSERKLRLRPIVPRKSERLLYCQHIEVDGMALFRLACEHDLEGIVAKHKGAPYLPEQKSAWLKIRSELFAMGRS